MRAVAVPITIYNSSSSVFSQSSNSLFWFSDSGFDGASLTCRNHISPVNLHRLLLIAAHQINIELSHAGLFKLLQPPNLFFDRPDDAEAVDHFVGDKFGVAAADLGVMQVVVAFAVIDIRG